jgi:hypothetical protein
MSYPLLRTIGAVPTTYLESLAESVSPDRAESLHTRFVQEEQLLQRASQRIIFGWGRYGRSRIYDENGRDVTLSDGEWIITLGAFGIVGFVAQFGLLIFPIFKARQTLKYVPSDREKRMLAAMCLALSINVFDLLPNATLMPWTWLIAGAVLGRAENVRYAKNSPKWPIMRVSTGQLSPDEMARSA